MPRRIVADPENGLPGKIEEHGTWVQGIYRVVAYAYGPGEIAPSDADRATIAELRAKYWNAGRRALVIPFNGAEYEFGAKLLNQTTDQTVVHVRREFFVPGHFDKPKEAGR